MRALQPTTSVLAVREYTSHDERILNWLSQEDFAAKQRDLIHKRQPGTGSWFINSTQYQRWLSDAGITELICPGIPGAGKTMMAAIVVEDLQRRVGRAGPRVAEADAVIHLYCSYERRGIEDISALLAALLRQLLHNFKTIPGPVRRLCTDHIEKGTRPTPEELGEALSTTAPHFRKVWIVLDALDECENDQQRTRDQLLLQVFSIPNAKVLGTCRPVPDIVSRFAGSPRIEIRTQSEDVQAFVNAELEHFPNFVREDRSVCETIRKKIMSDASGM